MNKFYFVLFILIFSLIYYGMHYYVYSQIANGLSLPRITRNYLKIFFFVAGLSFIFGEIISRQSTSFCVKLAAHSGTVWLGVISIAVSIFFIRNILLIFFHSQLFRYYSTVVFLIILAALSAYSFYNAAQKPRIKEIEIGIEKLPQELSGFTIIQLADLHLNSLKSTRWLETIVDETNKIKPDLIVITGDLIDADLQEFDDFRRVLNQLSSKYGIFAVTGNHEYFAGIDKFLAAMQDSDITVLRNEKVTIADSIELAGINDAAGKRFSESGPDLKSALKNCDLKKPVILLSHQPDIFDEASDSGVDLQLSAHTHAGQIPPIDLLVKFYFKYPCGLYRRGASYIYTTSGTGTWGPPMRLFSHSEIVKIVIKGVKLFKILEKI